MKAVRKAKVKAKMEKRHELQEGNHENFASRHQRAKLFSHWITLKYGLEYLRKGRET